jgi:lysophospholipase L1-like esterase
VTQRFLALGDSYTIGEGVKASERWPVQLVSRLRAERVDVADPEIIATTGWTTSELLASVDERSLDESYDLVTLLIGVNDQYRGWDIERFLAGFRALLGRALTLAGDRAGRVIVLSIPDWSATPFGARDPRGRASIAEEIDRFNAAARREAEHAGASFVDITPSSRGAAVDSSLLAADELHPSAAMYAQWVEAVLPVARRAFLEAERAAPQLPER